MKAMTTRRGTRTRRRTEKVQVQEGQRRRRRQKRQQQAKGSLTPRGIPTLRGPFCPKTGHLRLGALDTPCRWGHGACKGTLGFGGTLDDLWVGTWSLRKHFGFYRRRLQQHLQPQSQPPTPMITTTTWWQIYTAPLEINLLFMLQPKTALGSKLYRAPMQEATGPASTKQKETCAE